MVAGTNKSFNWDYDEDSDILNIHRNRKKVAGSAELGDFTIDFDRDGTVVGVEILNASGFFRRIAISKDQLAGLQTAAFSITSKGTLTLIWVRIAAGDVEQTVPIPAPVVAAAAV
jgi:uncharacterized protein YuzE